MDESYQAMQQKERGTIASKLGTWWQKIRKPLIAIAIIALVVVIVLGYWFNLPWVGVNGGYSKITTTSTAHGITTATEQLLTKTLWDWLQLLIVPLILAIGGFWLNQIQKSREERATVRRDKTEHEITLDKQREDLLQTYLDRMSELLLKEKLRSSKVDTEVRNVARVRTITILTQLDARRIGYVFAFLREAGLMSTTQSDNVVSLKNADLHAVNWSHASLGGADLSEADLSGADLSKANFYRPHGTDYDDDLVVTPRVVGANLSRANLSEALLFNVDLPRANLSGANLSGAKLLGTDLSGADLSKANLSEAVFIGATLYGTNLSEANLKGATGDATVAVEELEKHASLKGATMPDGLKHP